MGPALEVLLGLVFLFLVLSLAASAIVEVIGSAFKIRAKALQQTVEVMLGKAEDPKVAVAFVSTSTVKALKEAEAGLRFFGGRKTVLTPVSDRRATPRQLPARAFADGVVDVLTDLRSVESTADGLWKKLPPALQARLEPILDETGADLVAFKARVEQWFDDTMQGLEDTYHRWARKLAFVAGLLLTLALNASAVQVAQRLWADPISRQAAVAAVDDLVADKAAADVGSFTDVQKKLDELEAARIPLGWEGYRWTLGTFLASILGWAITSLAVLRGAPFWFDTLTRLTSLRKGAAPKATEDPASATTVLRQVTVPANRTLYGQVAADRASVATPATKPAQALFETIPCRS